MRVLINPAQCPLRSESDPIAALPQSDAMGQIRKTKRVSTRSPRRLLLQAFAHDINMISQLV